MEEKYSSSSSSLLDFLSDLIDNEMSLVTFDGTLIDCGKNAINKMFNFKLNNNHRFDEVYMRVRAP